MIKKKFRIKKIKEFGYMFRKGNKINGGALGLVWTKSYLPYSRLGISIGTKCGNAVQRNKVKRRLRAIYMDLFRLGLVQQKKNYIFICKPDISQMSFEDLQKACKRLFSKVGNGDN